MAFQLTIAVAEQAMMDDSDSEDTGTPASHKCPNEVLMYSIDSEGTGTHTSPKYPKEVLILIVLHCYVKYHEQDFPKILYSIEISRKILPISAFFWPEVQNSVSVSDFIFYLRHCMCMLPFKFFFTLVSHQSYFPSIENNFYRVAILNKGR